MKTNEVLEIILSGKQLSIQSKLVYEKAFRSLAEYTDEWPEKSIIVNEWIVAASKKYADTTVRIYFGVLKSSASYLDDNLGIDSVFKKIKTPRVEEKQRRYYGADTLLDILDSCRHGYDRELILTLIDSTCRIGELGIEPQDMERHPGLRGKNIDVENSSITTRGKTGYQKYRLDSRICLALKELAGSDNGHVFKDRLGKPASVNALRKRVIAISKRAGLTGEKLGPHTIRHSDGSLIARFTKSPLMVKALLGHKKISTSMHYIHDVEQDFQQEVSPLQLIADKAMENGNGDNLIQARQITIGEGESPGTDMVLATPELVEGEPEYTGDLFPEINDGMRARPLMKTDDLRLLRRVFIENQRLGGNHQDMIQARELMKRITRKIK